MLKNTLLGVLGGAVVGLLLGLLLVKPPTVETIRETVKELGAVPGNEFQNFVVVNGVSLWGKTSRIRTASSTLCELLSPAATSSLISGGIKFTHRPTTTLEVEVGKNVAFLIGAANITGTTTILATTSVPQATYGNRSFFATGTSVTGYTGTSTEAQARLDRVFSPSQWLTVKAFNENGDSAAGSLASGTCSALWQEL